MARTKTIRPRANRACQPTQVRGAPVPRPGESVGGPSSPAGLESRLGDRRLVPQGASEAEQPELGPEEQAVVLFLGPPEATIRLAAHPIVMSATLAEDFRALRAIAPLRPPGGAMPVPGKPYLAVPLPVDLPSLEMSVDAGA